MMIPKTITAHDNFCKASSEKRPYEKEWTKKTHKAEAITDDIYGVVCGHNNLIVIDCDKREIQSWWSLGVKSSKGLSLEE